MNNGIPQISISDRVNAAKSSTNPSVTDTSSVPDSVNPSPGDSSTPPVDTGAMNKAKADVPRSSQQARTGTSDNARKGQVKDASKIQYENREVNPEDQAKSPNRAEDISGTPPPKSKGFMESLMDKQMTSTMSNNTGGDINSKDPNTPTDTGDPNNVKKAPQKEPMRRDKLASFNNSNARVQDPADYQSAINIERVSKSNAPNLKLPNIKMPTIRRNF